MASSGNDKEREASKRALFATVSDLMLTPIQNHELARRLHALHEKRAKLAHDYMSESTRDEAIEEHARAYVDEIETRRFEQFGFEKPFNRKKAWKKALQQARADVPLPLAPPGQAESVHAFLQCLCNMLFEISQHCDNRYNDLEQRKRRLDPVADREMIDRINHTALRFMNIRNSLDYDWWNNITVAMHKIKDRTDLHQERYEALAAELSVMNTKCKAASIALENYDGILKRNYMKLGDARTGDKAAQNAIVTRRSEIHTLIFGLDELARRSGPVQSAAQRSAQFYR